MLENRGRVQFIDLLDGDGGDSIVASEVTEYDSKMLNRPWPRSALPEWIGSRSKLTNYKEAQ